MQRNQDLHFKIILISMSIYILNIHIMKYRLSIFYMQI